MAAAFLAALLTAPAQVAAQLITIDDFSTNQAALGLTYPPAGGTTSSSVSGPGILGGERDIQLNLSSAVIAGSTETAVVSSGFFSYSQDATVDGTAVLQWDGADGSPALNATGLGGIDLSAGGKQDAFQLNVFFDDLPTTVKIIVYTDAANASTMTLSLPGAIFSPTDFVLPYSAFAPSLGAGADFANVGAITLSVGSSLTAPDFVLNFLQTTSTVKASKTVAIVNDLNGNGLANAGDTLRYTIIVSNPVDTSGAPATGVVFTNQTPANTALVIGSVTTTQGSVTLGNTIGDTSVAVNLGTIPDAASATVTFDVTINNPLPDNVFQITCQGLVTTDTLPGGVLTDSPTLPGSSDATVIPVFPASVLVIPTLNEWGFFVLIGALLACGLGGLKKLRRSAV